MRCFSNSFAAVSSVVALQCNMELTCFTLPIGYLCISFRILPLLQHHSAMIIDYRIKYSNVMWHKNVLDYTERNNWWGTHYVPSLIENYDGFNYGIVSTGFLWSWKFWKGCGIWKCVSQAWKCFGKWRHIAKVLKRKLNCSDSNLDKSGQNLRRETTRKQDILMSSKSALILS